LQTRGWTISVEVHFIRKDEKVMNMRKLLLGMIMAFLVLGLSINPAAAQDQVQIKIDGELRNFSPGGRIADGRTMLPIRYIVEDPAVNGEAFWDPINYRVTIKTDADLFIFDINSPTAVVNGKAITLDVAPFIYQGRTYLPLRFFTEQMGASVGWKERENTVLINFNSDSLVMGYFYRGTLEELDHSVLTDVLFRWLETDGQGNLFYEYWSDNEGAERREAALERARQNGLRVHASVMLMGWNAAGRVQVHQLLGTPENRQRLISNLSAHAKQFGYDGINIDIEGIPADDRENFSIFMAELYQVLQKDDLTLSVAAPAKIAGSSWHMGFDYPAVGKSVDYLIIMAYDYTTSTPGVSAPVSWLEKAVDYAVSCMPSEKVILGMGLYGRDWNLDNNTKTTFYQHSLEALMNSSFDMAPGFDKVSYTPYIDYRDDNQKQHRVWYENSVSLGEKYAVALEYNLPGVSFWRLTGAFSDFYTMLGGQ